MTSIFDEVACGVIVAVSPVFAKVVVVLVATVEVVPTTT
jgi:hypothetical protein